MNRGKTIFTRAAGVRAGARESIEVGCNFI